MKKHKTIYTGKSKTSIKIDVEDVSILEGRSIWLSSHGYARTYSKGKEEYLHRLIMNPPSNKVVDHINGNKLDNRKINLRICKQSHNCLNKKIRTDNRTGVTGVWWRKERRNYAVQITVNKKRKCLGHFKDKFEAFCVRISAEKKYHGEYAATNGVLLNE